MQMEEGQEPMSPSKGATPSKRSNECHSPTVISTLPEKARIVPSEDLLYLHDSKRSSTITLEEPLDPSPEPPQHTDPSDGTTRPYRIKHPPKKYLDFDC